MLGVTIAAYRGEKWLGELTATAIKDVEQLQGLADQLTGRGIRLEGTV